MGAVSPSHLSLLLRSILRLGQHSVLFSLRALLCAAYSSGISCCWFPASKWKGDGFCCKSTKRSHEMRKPLDLWHERGTEHRQARVFLCLASSKHMVLDRCYLIPCNDTLPAA